jgi:soluble lytic murein transglycosylase-like protein
LRRLLAIPLLALPLAALCGEQKYEPLADSVRERLYRQVSAKGPATMHFRSEDDANRWLTTMEKRLEKRIPDRKLRLELLRTVQYEATRARLDPQLVLGVIEVESGFRKYAVSTAGARGYMQVMPFWIKLIGGPKDNLFHLRANIAYGCFILRHYVDQENGDFFRALMRYNGSLGSAKYPRLVLAAWKGRWKYDGPTA